MSLDPTYLSLCTPNEELPRFIGFEIYPVRNFGDHENTEFQTCAPEEAELWTLYGRKENGEAMALHDADNPAEAGRSLAFAIEGA